MFGCHGKIFFPMAPGHQFFPKLEKYENDENSLARSENVMVKPKKFTVGSPLTTYDHRLSCASPASMVSTAEIDTGSLFLNNIPMS